MSISRSAVTTAANVTWQGGTLFNGWLLLIASPPNISGTKFNSISLRDSSPKLKIPTRARIPIREGVLDQNCKIFQTSSLVPTNVVYSAWWYDDNGVLIATGASLFTITADPYTIAVPTLADPTTEIVNPTPESVPATLINTLVYNAPTEEDVAGTKNGSNTSFSISKTGTIFFLVWNGQVLTSGVDYTNVGTAITMISPALPNTGDQFKAVIFN